MRQFFLIRDVHDSITLQVAVDMLHAAAGFAALLIKDCSTVSVTSFKMFRCIASCSQGPGSSKPRLT